MDVVSEWVDTGGSVRFVKHNWIFAIASLGVVVAPILSSGGGIPGGSRTDLWNSLWSLWHGLSWPAGSTTWINHPDGGVFSVADPMNAVLFWPVVQLGGLKNYD